MRSRPGLPYPNRMLLALQAADAFDGSERVGRVLPRWAAEAVLRGRLPHLPQLKCAFVLYPAEARPRAPSPTAAASPACA